MLITLLEEGDSTMNPSYSILNTANSQNLFRATQILFGKKCVRSYLILRTNSEKKGENRNEEGRKRGSFSKWNLFLKNKKHTTCFYLIFTKIHSRKNEFRFS